MSADELCNNDFKFMGVALALARRHWGQTSPNPSVGAVLVQEDEIGPIIVGRGTTAQGGRPHAEPLAIAMAGDSAKGATLYVTLEPCNHHGQTPPCSEAIISAGIAKVVIGTSDPDNRVSGQGIESLKKAGIDVVVGCRQKEAQTLIRAHIISRTKKRPYVLAKIAVGSDDRVAKGGKNTEQLAPTWVTNELARKRGHLMRAEADVIIVGRETVELDNPTLTCRLPGMKHKSPIPIILDSHLKIDPELKLFIEDRSPKPVVITTKKQNNEKYALLESRSTEIIEIEQDENDQIDLGELMAYLMSEGHQHILIEGGPTLIHNCLAKNLVDELAIFKGLNPAGPESIPPFGEKELNWPIDELGFKELSSQELMGDTLTIYGKQTS